MSDAVRRWVRWAGGLAVLAVVVDRVGTGPFRTGLRSVGWSSALAVAGLTAATTCCCAWRWRIVARGLGVDIPVRTAIAAYYRSQLLNATLPAGVLGDVDRAVTSGRDAGDVGRGVRAVVWERTAGQLVQGVIAALVLMTMNSPLPVGIPLLIAALAAATLAVVLVAGRAAGSPGVLRAARADLRAGLLARASWPGVFVTSALVVAGHVVTFVIAVRSVGATASVREVVPLALIVLVASGLPANVGGWGPREGVAAWAFAAAGLGAGTGVAAATAFGVLTLIALAPGAAVLLWGRRRPRVAPAAVRASVPLGAGAHG